MKTVAKKTVTLFRHAKSGEKDNPDIADFDRPLSKRGTKVAPAMGQVLRKAKLKPDVILCSPSKRTRETLALAVPKAWAKGPHVRFEEPLYEASAKTLLKMLRELPDEAGHVLIVGHNPGLQDLAILLTEPGTPALEEFMQKLPTAAIASFAFDTERWRSLKPATGALQLFMTPNKLETGQG
jgi:phosphohistidine phosphatase